jgi:dipeptidyl aminopeptidase/acylaminoacyl peptidase
MMFLRAFLLLCFAMGANSEPVQAPPLKAYAALPQIDNVSLSLSGKYIGLVSDIGGQRVILMGQTGGQISHKFGIGDIKLRDLYWAGDDHLIAITSSTQDMGMRFGGLNKLFNLVIIDRQSGELHWPLRESKKVMNAAFDFHRPVKKKGRWYQCVDTLSLKFNARNRDVRIGDGELGLSCIDLMSGKLRTIAEGRKDGVDWLVGPELEVLAHAINDSANQRWVLRAGNDPDTPFSGPKVLAKNTTRYGSNRIISLGREPGTVLYSVHDDRGGVHIMETRLDGVGEPVELYKDLHTEALAADPETGLHVGYWQAGPVPELIMLDAKAQARVVGTRKAFPDSHVHFSAWSRNMDHLIVNTESDHDAGTWWHVNIAEGAADPIGKSFENIKPEQVASFRLWRYKAQDGLEIEAIITEPPGGAGKAAPLIVLPHGGPESRDLLAFNWKAQAFASRGYVVLQANFRGSSGFGLAFRNAGFGQWGRKMQTDLSDGIAELAKTGVIDPEKVCIVGSSYGGYAALAGVTLQKDIYRCAVSIAGVSDPEAMLKEAELYRWYNSQRYWRDFMGVKNSKDGVLETISPLAHAKKANAPILLLHGEEDVVVPIEHSKRMAKALKAADKPYKFVKLKTEDHHLSRQATRLQALEEAVRFVMKHNPPD